MISSNSTESLFPEDFPNVYRIGITGHRPRGLLSVPNHGYVDYAYCNTKLLEFMRSTMFPMILNKYPDPVCISGMALGADQAYMQVAQELGFKTVAVVPYPEQPNIWPKAAQEHYHQLCANATEVITVFPSGEAGLLDFRQMLFIRDNRLVDRCTNMVALHNGLPSGTGHTVGYAHQQGKPVANFWKLWRQYLK